MDVAGAKGAALQITELVVEETMSADEMIACLGSCRARGEIAAMIKLRHKGDACTALT